MLAAVQTIYILVPATRRAASETCEACEGIDARPPNQERAPLQAPYNNFCRRELKLYVPCHSYEALAERRNAKPENPEACSESQGFHVGLSVVSLDL